MNFNYTTKTPNAGGICLRQITFLALLFCLLSGQLSAVNYELTGGNWKSPSSWAGGTVPPNPLPSGDDVVVSGNATVNDDIVIAAGASLTVNNLVTLTVGNNRLLTIQGVLSNSGTLDILTNASFLNTGTFNNNSDGVFLNRGAAENSGAFNNNAAGDLAGNLYGLDNRGVFTNTGIIDNNGGTFRFALSETDDSFTNAAVGVIINRTSGTIFGTGPFTNSGDITNIGTLQNRGPFENAAGGDITNVGTFDATGTSDLFTNNGAYTNANGASFTNFGTTVNNGTFSNKIIGTVDNRNIFTNGAAGVITNGGVFHATRSPVDDTFTNEGTLINEDELNNRGMFVNNGILNNSLAGAVFSNLGSVAGGQATVKNGGAGAIGNKGTIDNKSIFVNDGKLVNAGDIGVGVNTAEDFFTNNGSLTNNAGFTGRATMVNTGTWDNAKTGVMDMLSTVTFSNEGALVNNGNIIIPPTGVISQTVAAASVSGVGTFTLGSGTFIATAGRFAPGNSIGTLTINGNLTLGANTSLEVEIERMSNDQLCVTGIVTMNGAINLYFLFTPTMDDVDDPTNFSYDVITCAVIYVDVPSGIFLFPGHTPFPEPPTYVTGTVSFVLTVLPIDLLSFTGEQEGETIRLAWTTVSEEDNDYMAVERSDDGTAFDEIGRVQGKGTTTVSQDYTLVDRSPRPGVNYYRLRQVDFDGATEYHPVIAVNFTGERRLSLQLAPNPVREELRVNWTAPGRGTVRVRLLDLQGRLREEHELDAGSGLLNLAVEELPAGIYFLQVIQGGRAETRRFVKQ